VVKVMCSGFTRRTQIGGIGFMGIYELFTYIVK
jgi:hypothetical protein